MTFGLSNCYYEHILNCVFADESIRVFRLD